MYLTLFLQPPEEKQWVLLYLKLDCMVSWKRTKTKATGVAVKNPEELSFVITKVWFSQIWTFVTSEKEKKVTLAQYWIKSVLSILGFCSQKFKFMLSQLSSVQDVQAPLCNISILLSLCNPAGHAALTNGFSALRVRFDWPRPAPRSLTDSFMNPHWGVLLWLRGHGVWCSLSHTYQEIIWWLSSKAYKISLWLTVVTIVGAIIGQYVLDWEPPV